MGMIIQPIFKIVKWIFKALWWIGTYWLIICMSPVWIYELIAPMWARSHGGTFLGVHPNGLGNILAPTWLYNVTFFLTLIFMSLTIYQNIRRSIMKEPRYNVFYSLFNFIGGSRSNSAMGKDFARAARYKEGEQQLVRRVSADNISGGFLFGKESNGVDKEGSPKKSPSKPKYVMQPQDTDGHVLIIGSPGSGKTANLAIPTLLGWKSRVFAIDIKGELYKKTKHVRKNIKVFNPTELNAYGYDPFYMLRNTDDISGEARSLAFSICPLSADVKDPFWIKSAQNMLTGFIIYYFDQDLSFSETMRKIKSMPAQQIIATIMEDEDQRAIMEVNQFDGLNDKTLAGIFTELTNHITVFATDDNLQRALNGEGDCITPQDLEDGYDVFCWIPEDKLDEWGALMGMMCNQFLKAFERRSENNKVPILFLIDEFPRLGKVEAISKGLATLRSKKIHIALIIQSISQLNAIYGKDIAEVIEDNCTYKAILFAAGSETQEWCSKLVGTYEKVKKSSNYNADIVGIGKGQGTSTTTEEKRIIKPEEFGKLIAQKQLIYLFPGGAARLDKIFYWKEPAFTALTE